MRVRIKLLNPLAKVPKRAFSDDFGYDVVATSVELVHRGVYRYGLGFALQADCQGDSMCFRLAPRSSVWKTGMVLSNSEGIIDMQYRGEVSAVFYHVVDSLPPYKVGDRIGQLFFMGGKSMEFDVVDDLDASERGAGGYGSTGV